MPPKGLEFPVVVLTALNAQTLQSHGSPSCSTGKRSRCGGIRRALEGGTDLKRPAMKLIAAREKELDEDERVRLLYVAATRARDHLGIEPISQYARGRNTDAAKIAEILRRQQKIYGSLAPPFAGTPPQPLAASSNGVSLDGHSLADRQAWQADRAETLRQQGRPVSVSATRLAQILKEEPDTDEPWRRGRAGTSVGRAVHSVLQTIDLVTGDGIEETSQAQAAAEGIPQRWAEVARLARVAVNSEVSSAGPCGGVPVLAGGAGGRSNEQRGATRLH